MKLSGWGRYPRIDCALAAPRDEAALASLVHASPLIARGNGRSYGDAALNRGMTVSMLHFNRMLDFDERTGVLSAEAGVLLGDIVTSFLPRGWFPAVTPGTKFVTVGGMIAADVHGKNHHLAGSLGNHVVWFDLLGPDGKVQRCSRDENAGLFENTLGGMGLTGIVLRAGLRLIPVRSAWIRQSTEVAPDLDAAMAILERSASSTYTVAWIDCLAGGEALGRSIVLSGEHAEPEELPVERRVQALVTPQRRSLSVPFDLPRLALNPLGMKAFNAAYYGAGKRNEGTRIVDWDSYFYPLDSVGDWNRIYGRPGFMQFQCVIPRDRSRQALSGILSRVSAAGSGSFLAVLKLFGPGAGGLSFPIEGYTLALDFPVDARTLRLMDELDGITADHGGHLYLAKDARVPRGVFDRMEKRAKDFRAFRALHGLDKRFSSVQSERLGL